MAAQAKDYGWEVCPNVNAVEARCCGLRRAHDGPCEFTRPQFFLQVGNKRIDASRPVDMYKAILEKCGEVMDVAAKIQERDQLQKDVWALMSRVNTLEEWKRQSQAKSFWQRMQAIFTR